MSEEPKLCVELHTLDISKPILTPSSLSSLAETCKTWGFFHITNHGISNDLYTKICSMSKDLFSLPIETKLKLGPLSTTKTYTPQFIASPFFESLRVNGPDFLASAQNSADILFDQNNSVFSDVLQEYCGKMAELSKKIMEILLMSLGDGFEKKYESEFKNCHGYLRINNYSPPQEDHDHDHHVDHDHDHHDGEITEGLGKHTDMSCVTIVYQDTLGGLQVRSEDGQWTDIVPCDGTLLVNIGDMLQAWSNEKLRSSEHRVVLRGPHKTSRFSIAFFWCFQDHKVVIAPDEIVGPPGCERAYKPFVCLDYLKFRQNDERGKFEKVGFTVKDFAGVNNNNNNNSNSSSH